MRYDTLELAIAHRLDSRTSLLYGVRSTPPADAACRRRCRRTPRVPPTHSLASRAQPHCYAKAVVKREGDQEVLGLHLVGPNAGEIIQGFAVAMRMGSLTMRTLRGTTGIHPTNAEELVGLSRTKRAGVSATKTSC